MDKKDEKNKQSREILKLTHVETKRQEIDKKSISGDLNFQKEHEMKLNAELQSEAISSEDKSFLVSFEKKRMLLDRIWIIANQARAQMQLEPLKRDEIKEKLLRLVKLGYLSYEEIPYEKSINEVFIMTDKAEDIIQ